MQDANAVYCIALKHLINHAHDAEGAVAAAEAWAAAHACVDIQSWMTESATPGPGPKCSANIGYVKWGFVYAFRGLRRRLQYREGLAEVLLQGGDTDTNAAIVGGMLGALHGAVNGIPQEMSGVVLSRSLMSQGQPRPGWLLSRRVPGMVQKLLECAAE